MQANWTKFEKVQILTQMTVSKPLMMSYLCHSEDTQFLLCFSEILTQTKFGNAWTKDKRDGGGGHFAQNCSTKAWSAHVITAS